MNEYLEKVMKHLPSELKAEIVSTGGGFYSITIPFDLYSIDIPGEWGGAMLYDNRGAYVITLTWEANPEKLAKFVTNLYEMNFRKVSK